MMEYVLMNAGHAAEVAELEKQCFSDPWSIKSILSEVENPLSAWFVACEQGEVVGYVGSQSVLGWADMMNLAVSPEHRRKGVAEQLVQRLVAHLKENAVSCLTLEVRVTNLPAITLYEKLGFTEVGRRPGYYHNPKEDALILRKEWSV